MNEIFYPYTNEGEVATAQCTIIERGTQCNYTYLKPTPQPVLIQLQPYKDDLLGAYAILILTIVVFRIAKLANQFWNAELQTEVQIATIGSTDGGCKEES